MDASFWFRFGVGGLSQVSPNRAAKLAHRFFRRPGLTKGYSSDDVRRLEEAQGLLSQGESQVSVIKGRRIASYHFSAMGPPLGAVLLLHGWSGDSRAMAAFPAVLTDAGYDVVAVDLPAHGSSDGVETDIVDAADVVASFLVTHSLHADHIIAHSFGGAVTSRLATLGVTPHSFTSISAPTNFGLVLAEVSAAFALSHRAEALFSQYVAETIQMDPAELDALSVWRDKATRILTLHAPDDERVSFAHAKHLSQAPNAELIPVQGLNHSEIVYAPGTVSAALSHIQQTDGVFATMPEVA